MNNCVHQWIYIGSKRQDVWRCIFCDEYKINDATPQREWVGLTNEEIHEATVGNVEGEHMLPYSFARAIEQAAKEKNK